MERQVGKVRHQRMNGIKKERAPRRSRKSTLRGSVERGSADKRGNLRKSRKEKYSQKILAVKVAHR